MRQCILCGIHIPDETLVCPQSTKQFQRVICHSCSQSEGRDSESLHLKKRIPKYAMNGCYNLSAAIVKGQVQNYISLYKTAIQAVSNCRTTNCDDVKKFIRTHEYMHDKYWDILTLGNAMGIIYNARKSVRKSLRSKPEIQAAQMIEDCLKWHEN